MSPSPWRSSVANTYFDWSSWDSTYWEHHTEGFIPLQLQLLYCRRCYRYKYLTYSSSTQKYRSHFHGVNRKCKCGRNQLVYQMWVDVECVSSLGDNCRAWRVENTRICVVNVTVVIILAWHKHCSRLRHAPMVFRVSEIQICDLTLTPVMTVTSPETWSIYQEYDKNSPDACHVQMGKENSRLCFYMTCAIFDTKFPIFLDRLISCWCQSFYYFAKNFRVYKLAFAKKFNF